MNKILSIVLAFVLTGCAFWEFQTGETYTNEENITAIERVQRIQEVYWLCRDNPEKIDELRASWEAQYGEYIVERGIKLYEENKQ